MDLPTGVIHTPEDNDIDMEAVEELRANMAEHGQLVEIIVFPHPTLGGTLHVRRRQPPPGGQAPAG